MRFLIFAVPEELFRQLLVAVVAANEIIVGRQALGWMVVHAERKRVGMILNKALAGKLNDDELAEFSVPLGMIESESNVGQLAKMLRSGILIGVRSGVVR